MRILFLCMTLIAAIPSQTFAQNAASLYEKARLIFVEHYRISEQVNQCGKEWQSQIDGYKFTCRKAGGSKSGCAEFSARLVQKGKECKALLATADNLYGSYAAAFQYAKQVDDKEKMQQTQPSSQQTTASTSSAAPKSPNTSGTRQATSTGNNREALGQGFVSVRDPEECLSSWSPIANTRNDKEYLKFSFTNACEETIIVHVKVENYAAGGSSCKTGAYCTVTRYRGETESASYVRCVEYTLPRLNEKYGRCRL